MQFDYAYLGNTAIDHRADRTALSFAPDIRRPPTFFSGKLRHSLAFREAISALHDVVVSDLRFQPRDKSEYKAWAAQREQEEWGLLQAEIGGQSRDVVARIQRAPSPAGGIGSATASSLGIVLPKATEVF